MRKFLCLCMAMVMLISVAMPVASVAQTVSYPEVTALQNDEGTFISMDGSLICELKENRYLRFRATGADDNWIGSECRGADLCIAYSDAGVKGIVIENADFTNNVDEGWFEIAVTGYKEGLDCNVEYSIKGTWLPNVGKFKYTYTTSMDADLEKWYQNSNVAKNYYNQNPNSTAPIEVADYHVENISYPDINNSESYQDMSQRYEWFLSSQDGGNWEKWPKVYIPYPTRNGNYLTIRKVGERCYEGAKFGFADSEHGGWISTITKTTAGINFELCWYFFDVHIIMYNVVPKPGTQERFELEFGMDFEPVSADEGKALVDGATERNWRSLEEYKLPLFTRNNTFDTLISDDVIESEKTSDHYIWWASSYDCFRDDTVGYDDNYSVSIKRSGKPARPVAWNTYTWGRPFEKESTSNHRYRLSAMVKTKDCTGDIRLAYGAQKNHADLFYGVGTHNGNGTPREDIILWQYSDTLTGTNDWTPISMEFTVNYYVNSIILEMNGSGQCWFDNVVIEDLGEITADSYYVYDDFENGKNDNWTINEGGVATVENGALVLEQAENATTFARAERGVKGYGGRWIAEMECSATTKVGTILAAASVFNLEVSGSTLLVKSGDASFNRVDTKFEKNYVPGTPMKFKFVMDFDTKAFELWYNDNKVDLGEGNYIRSGTIAKLSSLLAKVDHGYSGNVVIDKFMLYPDCDEGSVNISREALALCEKTEYRENIILPMAGINGTSIEWATSDETVVSDSGEICRGNIVKKAILTATISKNETKTTKSFAVQVAPYSGLQFTADKLTTRTDSTTAKVSVANDSADVYENPVLIMACYREGELLAMDIDEVDLTSDITVVDMACTHTERVDFVKIFLLEKGNLKPIDSSIEYEFASELMLTFDKALVNKGENVAFEAFELLDGDKIPLDKGSFELSCPGMSVDYDNGTVSFGNSGENLVTLSNGKGICTAVMLVNDADESVCIKGVSKFESDFSGSDALSTYYTSNGGAYSIGTNGEGERVLRTSGSNTADTLLFGPNLTDYAVEIEFTPTRLTGSGVNTIGIGLRAKSSSDHSAYRLVLAERWRFDGSNVFNNRLGIGRGKSSNAAEWFYADYSEEPFAQKFDLNKKYKLTASICGDRIQGVLYDADGNVLDIIDSTTDDCNYNKDGSKAGALTSGQTVISFHCMVADISDIRIYEYDKTGEIDVEASTIEADDGDIVTFTTYANGKVIDVSMVEYFSYDGLDISGNTARATEAGEYIVIAKYTDYAGKVKYGAVTIRIE